MQSAKSQFKTRNLFILFLNNKLLIFLLLGAFFLRMYNFQELFYYSHDNDLAGWFIKDILVNHHPRLIGQETSTKGIFIGPLFYYLQIPFYLLTGLDPIGGTILVALLGTFTVWSIYFVFSKIWDRTTGYVGSFIYAVSFYTILVDREVVPTMPVMLWTVWFLYSLWLLLKDRQKHAFPLLGILLGLIWHLNFALVLVLPLILVAFLLKGKRQIADQVRNDRVFDVKSFCIGIIFCFILSIPLIAFEFRHGFQQTHSLITSLTTDQQDVVEGSDKWIRTFHLASKDVAGIVWGSLFPIPFEYIHVFILILFLFLTWRKYITGKLAIVFGLWILLFHAFFSLYSKILSEYYLNGMIIVYIAILAIAIAHLIQSKRYRYIGFILLVVFAIINMYRFFSIPINKNGYLYRKAVIAEIKRDSTEKGFPCASISYITAPGDNLGYRYFIWRSELTTKPISNEVPVYTIVFPLKQIFKEDRSFGAIGLIYPEYSKYNSDSVKESCEGEDWNLVEPMFGFNNR